jgi:hypothetical protein
MRTFFANPAFAAVLIVIAVAWPASRGAELQTESGEPPAGSEAPRTSAAPQTNAAPHPPETKVQDAKAKAEQRVSGDVVDRDGKAVEDAEVAFAGPKKHSVRTGAGGAFSFTGPPGNYVVTVHAGKRTQTFDDMKIEDGQLKPRTRLVIDREDPPN